MALADELTIKDWIGFSRAVSDAYVQVDVPGTPFVCPCHGSLPRRASISEGDTVTMKYRAHPIYDETREASGTLSFKVGSRSAGPAFDAMARETVLGSQFDCLVREEVAQGIVHHWPGLARGSQIRVFISIEAVK